MSWFESILTGISLHPYRLGRSLEDLLHFALWSQDWEVKSPKYRLGGRVDRVLGPWRG